MPGIWHAVDSISNVIRIGQVSKKSTSQECKTTMGHLAGGPVV